MALASIQWSQNAWSQYDPTQVLANVIQGEAGSFEGQTAVATVIQNRLNAGAAGGFGDSLQSVVTPSQFNGWGNASKDSTAYALAQQIVTGAPLPDSAAGNALYFASPASNNAWWANPANPQGVTNTGVNIGGNYFSDTMGAPSSNFSSAGASDASGVAQSNASGSDPLGVFPLTGALGAMAGGGSSGAASSGGGATAAQQSSWLEEIFANTKDLFQRGLIGLAGVVLLLGALMYLALSKRAEASPSP